MAGAPKKRAKMAALDPREEEILDLRASGATTREVLDAAGVSVRVLYGWLGKDGSDESRHKGVDEDGVSRRARWDAASKLGAVERGEGSGKHFDVLTTEEGRIAADVTREEISLAKARSDHDKWLAGKLDPATYGDTSAKLLGTGGPVINVQQLHLHAVQSRQRVQAAPEDIPEGEAVPLLVTSQV